MKAKALAVVLKFARAILRGRQAVSPNHRSAYSELAYSYLTLSSLYSFLRVSYRSDYQTLFAQ